MKKRLLLFLCIFTLLLSTAAQAEDVTADVPAPAPSAEKADTLSPFARMRSYDGRFTDVDASAWYHDAVAALYEYGLTEGVSSSAYAPEGSVTIAELVTFAARLHALERGAAIPAAAAGEAWYQPYVRYLKAEKCLGDELDGHYPEAATRAQMAGPRAQHGVLRRAQRRGRDRRLCLAPPHHRRGRLHALSERYSPALQVGHRGWRERGRLLPSE